MKQFLDKLGTFLIAIFMAGFGAFQGAMFMTLIPFIILAFPFLLISTIWWIGGWPQPQLEWETFRPWVIGYYSVLCTTAFFNTFFCVFFDKDNIINTICLTSNPKPPSEKRA